MNKKLDLTKFRGGWITKKQLILIERIEPHAPFKYHGKQVVEASRYIENWSYLVKENIIKENL